MAKTIIKLVMLVLLYTTAVQASPAVAVFGTVLDNNAQPLGGVTLTLQSSNVTRVMTTSAAGYYEFLAQPFPLPIDNFYTLAPVLANYTFSPPSATLFLFPGGSAVAQSFVGNLGSITTSPLDTPEFFVRQQYLDLLKREPDESGLGFWSGALKACTTQACRYQKRRDVMCAFVQSGEYQGRFTGVGITVCQ